MPTGNILSLNDLLCIVPAVQIRTIKEEEKMKSFCKGLLFIGLFMLSVGSAHALSVFDNNNQLLGAYAGDDNTVLINIAGGRVVLFDSSGRVNGGYLDFTSSDCTGTPYFQSFMMSYQRVIGIGETLWTGTKNIPVEITVCSYMDESGACTVMCPEYSATNTDVPAIELTDKMPFNYPVAYPLTIK